jgi:hypothetical protein
MMPHKSFWERHGLHQKFFGVITSPAFKQSVFEIYGDSRFDSLRYVITDFLDVQRFDVDLETVVDVHTANIGARVSNPDILVAIVTTDPKIVSFGQLASNQDMKSYPTEIFSTLDDARHWIHENALNSSRFL